MLKVREIKAMPGHRLWIRFENGVEGTADLSDLAGRGVFAVWDRQGAFEAAEIGGSSVRWGDDVDLCADALFLRVTGSLPSDLFPRLPQEALIA